MQKESNKVQKTQGITATLHISKEAVGRFVHEITAALMSITEIYKRLLMSAKVTGPTRKSVEFPYGGDALTKQMGALTKQMGATTPTGSVDTGDTNK